MTSNSFASVEEAISAIAAGRVVIVVDSEDREDEGDFVVAAEAITPEIIHFLISQGRGQLCMPVLPDLADRLCLELMVKKRPDELAPRFAIPVDHITCKTGISPWERAHTIRSMLNPSSRADDFLRPGHIFPLIARPEGVLARTGHTEAAVDLARLAGLTPAGVLCEICSRDGLHMADRLELFALAFEFRIPIVTIDALVEFRCRPKCSAERASTHQLVSL